MKFMIINFWVTLTFYNSILISSCIGGALPYLQQNPQQNQIINRSPSNSYGAPTIQPIVDHIQQQNLLNIVPHRPQLLQSNLIQSQPQKPQVLQYQNKQQHLQQPQQQQQQKQHQSIRQPLLLPPPPLPAISNQRQPLPQFQNIQQSQHAYVGVQQSQQKYTQKQPLIPQLSLPSSQDAKGNNLNYASAPSQHAFNSFAPQQQQQQQSMTMVQSSIHLQPYNFQQTAALQPLTPPPLPPLQPGPTNSRIFSTSAAIGDEKKIASNHIIVENYSTEDSDSFLTGAKNSTLYAAQLLAKSLLEASHENDSNYYNNNQQLNKTDLVVVKTQKKAYIIPMNLQGHRLNQTEAQELYQNRDKLPVAYTVNQFLFIIKPENVNFLNKLV